MEKNNLALVRNVLYPKNEKMYPAYFSSYNSNRCKESFNYPKGRRMAFYLAVKKITLLTH